MSSKLLKTFVAIYYHGDDPYPPGQQIDEIEASSLAAATRAAKSKVGTHHHDRLVSVYEKDAGTGEGQ